MTATEFDEKATWLADIQVRLPDSIGCGRLADDGCSETDGTQVEVPIVIRVVKN